MARVGVGVGGVAESGVGKVGPTVCGGCCVGAKFEWSTVFGRGGGLELTVFGGGALSFALFGGSTGESGGGRLGGGGFVFGVAFSIAFGTVFGAVRGDGLESGGPVAFGIVCGAVGVGCVV